MSTPVRLAAFAALLVVLGVAGAGVGAAVGPVGPGASAAPAAHDAGDDHATGEAPADPMGSGEHGSDDEHGTTGDHDDAHGERPSGVTGLAVSEDGYTLRPEATRLPVGTSDYRFVLEGPDGAPVTAFDTTHERELHLVVVRRDGTGFQHLHPEQDAAGTWSTPLALDAAGPYRVFADFAPADEPARTLAADLTVPGEYDVAVDRGPSSVARVDGYEVTLTGGLGDGEVAFAVSRDGAPVDDLEPYLGAAGHLVVLREGDLGYLHVHPEAGDALAFAAEAPSTGRYRLFLQFQHDGVVRTAAFPQEVA